MILVDTSVWIDHLRARDERLVDLLEADEVGVHPFVIEELAVGTLPDRDTMLSALGALRSFPVLGHAEVLHLVESRGLWGRGLGAVDMHLIGSARVQRGGQLWTRDKRLRSAALEVGVPVVP